MSIIRLSFVGAAVSTLVVAGVLVAAGPAVAHSPTPTAARQASGVAATAAAGTPTTSGWTPTQVPRPANADRIGDATTLTAMVCPTARRCVAAGSYAATNGSWQGWLETLAGGHWTAAHAPLPVNAASRYSAGLVAVACPVAGSCVATGSYNLTNSTDGSSWGLLETFAGGRWTARQAPLPANAKSSGNAALSAVACPAAGRCVAVGDYTTTSGTRRGLLETLAGGHWTASQAPLPANASLHGSPFLSSVACPAAGRCVVTGDYTTTSGTRRGLLETLAGGHWTATQVPLPANANSRRNVSLSAVACPGAGRCVAIGSYTPTTSTYPQAMLETLTGGHWTAGQAPLPANASGNGWNDKLAAVACSAGGRCVAAGYYTTTSGVTQGWLETLAGGHWTATQAPLPANTNSYESAYLGAVACPASGNCIATGYTPTANGIDSQAMLETLTGGHWTVSLAPLPANASRSENAYLTAVACPASGRCIAIGDYSDANEDLREMVETQSGR